jgi:hypothetical protein
MNVGKQKMTNGSGISLMLQAPLTIVGFTTNLLPCYRFLTSRIVAPWPLFGADQVALPGNTLDTKPAPWLRVSARKGYTVRTASHAL